MVRTAFRPSDDACIYQLLVPANMMWAKYLEEASIIMEKLSGDEAKNLTDTMRDQAYGVRKGIDEDAIIHNKDFGDIFAYEIDGFGGTNMIDDANVPSLLAMSLWNYSTSAFKLPVPTEGGNPRDYDRIYANTRRFILSESNPYFMKGPVISAIGGPHLGPGKAWPMAAIIRALTAFTLPPLDGEGSVEQSKKKAVEDEIKAQIAMVLNSTAGTGGTFLLSCLILCPFSLLLSLEMESLMCNQLFTRVSIHGMRTIGAEPGLDGRMVYLGS